MEEKTVWNDHEAAFIEYMRVVRCTDIACDVDEAAAVAAWRKANAACPLSDEDIAALRESEQAKEQPITIGHELLAGVVDEPAVLAAWAAAVADITAPATDPATAMST
jgi:hypothetical protein